MPALCFLNHLAVAVLPLRNPGSFGQTVLKQTLAVRAERRTWHGLIDRTGNRHLAATGELSLSDDAWGALLPRWDGYAVLLLPREYAQPAADAREAAADAAEGLCGHLRALKVRCPLGSTNAARAFSAI